jgi:excisionase family DNA binding protein
MTPSPLLSVEEVAEYLRLSPRWVYEEVRTGRLRAVRIARSWRIKVSDLDEFVESFRP